MKSKRFVEDELLFNVVETPLETNIDDVKGSIETILTIAQPPESVVRYNYGKLIFNKMTDTAIVPSKKDSDAGFDLYADIPLDTDHFEIKPHTSKSVPTGIRTAIPEGFVGLLEERGSTGSINMKRNAGVVDSGYRGEIFVLLYNGNNKTVVLSRGLEKTVEYKDCIYYPMSKAIAQMMVVPVPKFEVVEYSTEDFNKLTTERGEGKLGSSGK